MNEERLIGSRAMAILGGFYIWQAQWEYGFGI
jgi:hypothetical protein